MTTSLVTKLQAVLDDADNVIQPYHETAIAEAIEQLSTIENLLARTPKVTNDIYVGNDKIAWGKQAKGVLTSIRAKS